MGHTFGQSVNMRCHNQQSILATNSQFEMDAETKKERPIPQDNCQNMMAQSASYRIPLYQNSEAYRGRLGKVNTITCLNLENKIHTIDYTHR